MSSVLSPVEHRENSKVANMNTGKAIFFGLALIALAIVSRNVVPLTTASSSEVGRYAIAGMGKDAYFYWKMDTATGAVQQCKHSAGVCK